MSKASDLARLLTSGSTSLHGEAGVTASGSTGLTTNLQQGLAKAWVTFDGTASGATIGDSLNVSSSDDDATGKYGINLSNAMTNTDFSTTFGDGQGAASSGLRFIVDAGSTTSSQEIVGRNVSTTLTDCAGASMDIHGDLA